MKVSHMAGVKHRILVGQLALLLICAGANAASAATVIYQTGFEGYDTQADLVGQNGWLGLGSGGNGIVSGFFAATGQQAYVGFTPPATNETTLFVYQPINRSVPQIQFSVMLAIIDSTTNHPNRDDFYWSVFNQQGKQLFTLDFDNFDLGLYFYLDNTNGRTWSGLNFTNGGAYPLSIAMDFTSNRWSAIFNGKPVATNQPITTMGAALNLGDVDAAWAVFNPKAPGDNFMVFDDYRISADAPPPGLTILGRINGSPALRVTGITANRYALEASTNLLSWVSLQTNVVSGGQLDYVDDTASGLPRRFYRARWVP